MRWQADASALLGSCLGLVLVDAIVTDIVSALGGGNNAEVVAELGLLEELLSEVLEVARGELSVEFIAGRRRIVFATDRFWKATSVVTVSLEPSRLMVTLPLSWPVLPLTLTRLLRKVS